MYFDYPLYVRGAYAVLSNNRHWHCCAYPGRKYISNMKSSEPEVAVKELTSSSTAEKKEAALLMLKKEGPYRPS